MRTSFKRQACSESWCATVTGTNLNWPSVHALAQGLKAFVQIQCSALWPKKGTTRRREAIAECYFLDANRTVSPKAFDQRVVWLYSYTNQDTYLPVLQCELTTCSSSCCMDDASVSCHEEISTHTSLKAQSSKSFGGQSENCSHVTV